MLSNFILENANNPGTGTISLAGAPAGRRTFLSAFATGSVVFYVIDDGTQTEVGYGTLTAGPPSTLARTPTWTSAGGTSPLNFTGAVRVYNTVPAERALWADQNSIIRAQYRKISDLSAGVLAGDAARVDQVAWQTISTAVFTSPQSVVIFSLPSTFARFRVEYQRFLPSGGASAAYCRLSQDGGTTYLQGASDYNTLITYSNSAGAAPAVSAGLASYVTLSANTTTVVNGTIDIDPFDGRLVSDGFCVDSAGHLTAVSTRATAAVSTPATTILLGFVGINCGFGQLRLLGATS